MVQVRSRWVTSLSLVLLRSLLAGAALVLGACGHDFECTYTCPPDSTSFPDTTRNASDVFEAQGMCQQAQSSACGEEGAALCSCTEALSEFAGIYDLVITPGTWQLRPGEAATFLVELVAHHGDVDTEVHFGLEGLPPPLSGAFEPERVLDPEPKTVLTITAPSEAEPATYGDIEVSASMQGHKVAVQHLALSVIQPEAPDFSLDVRPEAVDFTASSTVSLRLEATPSHGFEGTIELALGELPDDVSVVNAIAPSSLIVVGDRSTVSFLRLGFTPTLPVPATASFVLTATSPDGPTHSRTVTVSYPSVTSPGFTLSADRSELVLTPGGTDTATVTVTGAPAAVQLAASGLPPEVTATFDPAEVAGTGTSLLTLAASAQATPGPPATFYLYGSTTSGLSQSVPLLISIIPR